MGAGGRSALWPAVVCIAAACSIEDAPLGERAPRDAGGDDAGADGSAADGSVEGGRGDAGPPDAGPPPEPVGPLTLATSGAFGVHPAVTWTGTDFAVLFVMGDASGGQVLLARMRPGASPHETVVIAPDVVARRSLTLASRDGALALGWVELVGADWVLDARVLGSGPAGRFSPVKIDSDYDDAQLFWEGTTLHAAVRRDVGGADHLGTVRFGATPVFEGDFAMPPGSRGELAALVTDRGPLLATGLGASLHLFEAGSFHSAGALTGFVSALEGDLAQLPGGSLRAVWSDDPGSDRPLVTVRMSPTGTGWTQDGPPQPLGGWRGPDPALAAAGDRLVLAWPDTTDGGRDLGLALLQGDGTVLAGRCSPPMVHSVVNDPDVACGRGTCAVVWLEAESYDASDFVTRVLSVPADPARFCP